MITKSKYVDYITCNRLPYLVENYPDKAIISEFDYQIMQEGIEVGKVARKYFGDYVLVDSENKVQQTKQFLNDGEKVIAEASFVYEDLYCAVDLFKVCDNGYEIYEVKSSSDLHNSFIDDVSFQTYVLTKLGYNIINSYVLYINKDYVLEDNLDLKKLFNKVKIDIKDDVDENINKMRNETKLNNLVACPNCASGKCSYFNYCYSHLEKNNIFKLSGLRNAYMYYNDGIVTFEDFLYKQPPKTGLVYKKNIEQIIHELYDLPIKVEKDNLNNFLNTLQYPLYYLDFETIRNVIPRYEGYKTNQVMLTQYSLHIQETVKGDLIHKEYLLTEQYDNKEEVAKSLIDNLGDKGSIIVYNKSFESGVITQLSNMIPKYKNQLLDINSRLVDLEIPFKNRYVYNKKMVGKSSIKKVLPAMRDDFENAYENLTLVHNGVDAMLMYNKLLITTGEEKEKIKNGLLEYCCLDTLAMVAILEKLYEL